MTATIDIPATLIYRWHTMAQVEYAGLYTRLFISYNAWYRRVTGGTTDREALQALKRRHVIWDEMMEGSTAIHLRESLSTIIAMQTGLSETAQRWRRCLDNENDWRGLIDFWYAVRCDVFHGNVDPTETVLLRYAYESLNLFMTEVIRRMHRTFQEDDRLRLAELEQLIAADRSPPQQLITERKQLYDKFIRSPELWNADMEPAVP